MQRFSALAGSDRTTKMVKEFHNRHFILRASESAEASNPRNHITTNASIGTSVGNTVFSTWPGELGISAIRDLQLKREFADIARQEWASVGLRKGYMYMADLSTEPRWSRINGTFGENAEWVAQII